MSRDTLRPRPAMPSLATQFGRFCVVGAVGFVVDAGVLTLVLATTGIGPYWGRVVSFLVAATLTWSLHRGWTFGHAKRRPHGRQWAAFVAVNGVGAAINYGVYAALLAGTELVAAWPVLGVAAGSVAAMLVNFAASRRLVFRA